MIHTRIDTETQADIKIFGKIDDCFNQFKMAASLHQCRIIKTTWASRAHLDFGHMYPAFCGGKFLQGHCNQRPYISSIPDRQSDDKRGPLAFLAGDIQPPAVSGDDVVGNAES